MLFYHSARGGKPPAADFLLGTPFSMQKRCKTAVGRRWRAKCRFGAPVWPLWAPTAAKQVPKTSKMTSK